MANPNKSYLDLLNEKNLARRKRMLFKSEIERTREYLLKLEEDKRLAKELEARLLKEKEEEERIEKERLFNEAEAKRKTKAYFEINRYNRKIPEKNEAYYFGEYITSSSNVGLGKKAETAAWLPNGPGQFYVKDQLRYEGTFSRGKLQGIGTFVLDDGMKWMGMFKNGMMDGIGTLMDRKGLSREVLMRNNLVVCDRAEIEIGKQVEIRDPRYVPGLGAVDPTRVVVLSHVKGWTYKCRMQQELEAREREINFSMLASFEVLHHLPSVFFASDPDPPSQYDYFVDTYGPSGRPRLGVAGGRLDAQLRGAIGCSALVAEHRRKSAHKENVFESAAVGLGAAIEAERARQTAELQNKQMSELLTRRRLQEEDARKKRIAEEQARYLDEQLKQSAEERRQEQESFRQGIAARVRKETEIWRAKEAEAEARERLRKALEKGIGGLFEKGQLVFAGLRVEGARDPAWKGTQTLYLKLSFDASLSCRTAALADDGAGACAWGDAVVVDGVSEDISIPVTDTVLQTMPLLVQVWDSNSSSSRRSKDVLLFEGSTNVAGLCDTRRDDIVLQLRPHVSNSKPRTTNGLDVEDYPCRALLAMHLLEGDSEERELT